MLAARKHSSKLVCAFSCTVRPCTAGCWGGLRKGEVADGSSVSQGCPAGWWVGGWVQPRSAAVEVKERF